MKISDIYEFLLNYEYEISLGEVIVFIIIFIILIIIDVLKWRYYGKK